NDPRGEKEQERYQVEDEQVITRRLYVTESKRHPQRERKYDNVSYQKEQIIPLGYQGHNFMYHGIERLMNQETVERPKKVLFLITKATRGGAQRYVRDLVLHLPPAYRAAVIYGEAGTLSEQLKA